MPGIAETNLSTVLQGIQARFVSTGLFAPELVFFCLEPKQLIFPASDQFAVITPGRVKADPVQWMGGGRDVMLMHGTCSVTLWCRLYLDQKRAEDSWLHDGLFGSLLVIEQVINSLAVFQVLDSSGNIVLHKGLQLDEINSFHRDNKGVGWGAVETIWKFDYQQKLTPQTEFSPLTGT